MSPPQGLENNLISWNAGLWQPASPLACQFLPLVPFILLRYSPRYHWRPYLNSKDISDITQEEQHHYCGALQPPKASEPAGVVVCCAAGPWCLILQVNMWLIHPTALGDHKYQAFLIGHVHVELTNTALWAVNTQTWNNPSLKPELKALQVCGISCSKVDCVVSTRVVPDENYAVWFHNKSI